MISGSLAMLSCLRGPIRSLRDSCTSGIIEVFLRVASRVRTEVLLLVGPLLPRSSLHPLPVNDQHRLVSVQELCHGPYVPVTILCITQLAVSPNTIASHSWIRDAILGRRFSTQVRQGNGVCMQALPCTDSNIPRSHIGSYYN